ncbi:50S ribosomal protein L11 methyltransferase [Oculatella sp. LEGE 06141]|uniref:50S ribosomal protein L11 methyltransferase n=1 Tax=Oculatella sp. LEGE 06141 TaxID=1828648 RepID=UPI00188292DB|nr:50S ribosomal protein L11 methyltransferase [Oculatella sp. LEGE 06141]MBE9181183.1 50S ribosomal protein L11 methyltransferase [Oculatella sp. LEGE 06141]
MSLVELSLDTTHEAVDWVCTLLSDTPYTGEVHITRYVEPEQPCLVESDQATESPWAFTICFYLPYDLRVRDRVQTIESLLSPLHRTGLTTELQTTVVEAAASTSERDPLIHRIGKQFVVLAPDTPYLPETRDIPLRLKQSLAFGSGLHPATVLSLQLIERHVTPGLNTLDLGCGSGILAVAMAKLGAQVVALDNDGVAVEAAQAAVCCNQVEAQVTVMEGSLGCGSDLGHWMGGHIAGDVPSLEATAQFDLIVVNILARVHIALAPDLRRALRQTDRHTGLLITSGFTTDREAEVDAALLNAGFAAIDCERCNEWVALAHRLVR